MKHIKFFALASLALCATGAFADAADLLVSFETKADKYADGSSVLDGEWYALCWSPDGVFEGLNLDCTPVDANDLVIMKASLAKGGKCPYTVFHIDSKSPNCKREGTYTVVMLDTRDAQGKVATQSPTKVKAAVASQSYTAQSTQAGGAAEKPMTAGASWTALVDTSDPAFKPATIKGFAVVEDARVKIEVENMLPGVKYNVKMGEEPNKLDSYGLKTPVDSTSATFLVDKKDAKFFQLTREPLTK